jgi:hypothetical protein
MYAADTSNLTLTVPAAAFPTARIYRARLDAAVANFNSHVSHPYFTIVP